jgi:hypothetical protein
VLLGEPPGGGRQALLEQFDELGTDVGAQSVPPCRGVGPRDAGNLGRDEVEEAGVARLVTGLGAEGRLHRVVGRGRLIGTELAGHRCLGDDEACDQSEDLGVLAVRELRPCPAVGRVVDVFLVPLQRLGE